MKKYASRKALLPSREILVLTFGVAVVLVIAIIWYTRWVEFRRCNERQDITRRIVRATNALLSTPKDIEAGQHGFRVTGQESYLGPHSEALSRLPQELSELTGVVASRPDEAQRIEQEKPADAFKTIMQRRAKGYRQEATGFFSGQSKDTMNQIRQIPAEIWTVPDEQLTVQSADILKGGNETGLINIIGAITLLCLLGLAMRTIQIGSCRRPRLVEELAASQEENRRGRDWFQSTLGSLGDAVIATDANSKITFLNEVAASLTGWAENDAIGMRLDRVFVIRNKTTDIQVESPVFPVLSDSRGVGPSKSTKLIAGNGNETWIDHSAAPIRDSSGNVIGSVLVFRNITKEKEAEEEISRAEQRFRTAVSAVSDILWTNNAKGEMEGEQPGWSSFTGQLREEYQGYGWAKAVHPDDAQPTIDEWNRAVAERRKFSFEHRVRRHDGMWRDCSICALPMKDTVGEIQEWVGVHTDITEKKEAERTFKESLERFHFMAESMPQKIFTANHKGEVTYFNRQWTDFTGLTFEQIRDWGWTQFIHPDDVQENVRIWQHSINTGDFFQFIHRFRRKDGVYRWHLSRAHAMRDAKGAISMWIGSNTEIHEERETQEKLTRANQDLESFAYSASHDLQEPLRMITSFSELLVSRYRGQLESEAEMYLGFITEGTQRMRDLLSDLLSYTAVDAKTTDDTETIDLPQLIEEVIKGMRVAIEESGATVTTDPLPVISGHKAHFVQLFQNLISNAIKYRSSRPCQIRISVQEQDGNPRFSVADNGMGIAPEYHEKIFGVFKRLHGKTIPGTGIGLAICQRVVERYQGRLWVESEPDRGSTFFFTLPIGSVIRDVSERHSH